MSSTLAVQPKVPPALTLSRCVDVCAATLERYDLADRPIAETPFAAALLPAIAAMEVATTIRAGDSRLDGALHVVISTASTAAVAARSHGLDPALLRRAGALDRAVAISSAALRHH